MQVGSPEGRSGVRIRRALILKPCCLGDVLLATPLAAALVESARSAGRDLRLDWAVDAHSRPALRGNPHLAGLLDASHCLRGDLRPSAWLSLLSRIRRGGYDALFVPDRSPLLSLLAGLSGIPLRVGLASGWRGFGYDLRVPTAPDDPRHEAEIYLALARAIGIDVDGAGDSAADVEVDADGDLDVEPDLPIRPVYRCRPEDRSRVDAILRDLGVDPAGAEDASRPWIAVHPGGGVNPGMRLTEKRWPAERFAAVVEGLQAQFDARVFVLGARGDRDPVEGLLRALPSVRRQEIVDLCGRLGLAELAALVERCRLYLGNDSGISKLAAAVGTPVVEIFGPTDPARYGPLPGCGLAVRPELHPTGASDLGDAALHRDPVRDLATARASRAIEAVTVEAVWSAIEASLKDTRG